MKLYYYLKIDISNIPNGNEKVSMALQLVPVDLLNAGEWMYTAPCAAEAYACAEASA
jgi:hypothetical protein